MALPRVNYCAYVDPGSGETRVGHLDLQIQPLSFISGTRVENLYQIIEAGEDNAVSSRENPLPLSQVKLRPREELRGKRKRVQLIRVRLVG
jgi:hypothetical protein